MARQIKFIKDEVLVRDIHGFTGAITVVKGRWKVGVPTTLTAVPPLLQSIRRRYTHVETFVALDDVTDEMLEIGVGDVSRTKQKIYQAALPIIRQTHLKQD